MIPLHKHPRGLLGALELKALGRAPDELGAVVQPLFDLTDLYLAPNLQRIGTTMTIAGGSGATVLSTGLRIPINQNWRVLGMSMSSALDAADAAIVVYATMGATAAVSPSDTTILFNQQSIGNNIFRTAGFMPARTLYLPSGWVASFTIHLSAAPAANLVTTCEVLAQVLPD